MHGIKEKWRQSRKKVGSTSVVQYEKKFRLHKRQCEGTIIKGEVDQRRDIFL